MRRVELLGDPVAAARRVELEHEVARRGAARARLRSPPRGRTADRDSMKGASNSRRSSPWTSSSIETSTLVPKYLRARRSRPT